MPFVELDHNDAGYACFELADFGGAHLTEALDIKLWTIQTTELCLRLTVQSSEMRFAVNSRQQTLSKVAVSVGLWQTLAFVLRAKTKMRASTMYLEVCSDGELAEPIELAMTSSLRLLSLATTASAACRTRFGSGRRCSAWESAVAAVHRAAVPRPHRSVFSMQEPLAYSVNASLMNLVDAVHHAGGDGRRAGPD